MHIGCSDDPHRIHWYKNFNGWQEWAPFSWRTPRQKGTFNGSHALRASSALVPTLFPNSILGGGKIMGDCRRPTSRKPICGSIENLSNTAQCFLFCSQFLHTRGKLDSPLQWKNRPPHGVKFYWNPSETKNNYYGKKSQYLVLLEADRPPFTFPSVMNEIGFFGWVSSILLFIFKAFSREGRLNMRPAILFVSTFLFFYSIWIWGMFNA